MGGGNRDAILFTTDCYVIRTQLTAGEVVM